MRKILFPSLIYYGNRIIGIMDGQKKEGVKEKKIFDAIAKGDLAEFNNFLAQHKGSVDLYDENGMTALQHAAYKGNKDMVQALLDRVSNIGILLPHGLLRLRSNLHCGSHYLLPCIIDPL